MLTELSSVLVPLVLSFALFMFLLPVVDKLSVRPTRCCTSTYPTYCIDGYEQCIFTGGTIQEQSRGRRRARCYRGLLLCIFPRPVAVLLAVCLVLCVVAVVGVIVAASIVDAVDSADQYIEKLDDILNSTRFWMYDLGLNDTDIDSMYSQIPATAVAVGGVTTLGGAVLDFFIILLFATSDHQFPRPEKFAISEYLRWLSCVHSGIYVLNSEERGRRLGTSTLACTSYLLSLSTRTEQDAAIVCHRSIKIWTREFVSMHCATCARWFLTGNLRMLRAKAS